MIYLKFAQGMVIKSALITAEQKGQCAKTNLLLGTEEQCSICLFKRQTQRFQNITAPTLHPIKILVTAQKGDTDLLLTIVETRNCLVSQLPKFSEGVTPATCPHDNTI